MVGENGLGLLCIQTSLVKGKYILIQRQLSDDLIATFLNNISSMSIPIYLFEYDINLIDNAHCTNIEFDLINNNINNKYTESNYDLS
ncbi:MAG: hypothetical protein IPK03_03475 [Bacteroidetes bacterium]|nr:hypothetical protein [Bacteroidota bacterium]